MKLFQKDKLQKQKLSHYVNLKRNMLALLGLSVLYTGISLKEMVWN